MRPLSCSSTQNPRSRGFTLVELMVVLGIVLMILGLLAPSMGGVLKGKKIEQAISSVTGALEAARMEAISQNTYIWVGLLNVSPPNTSSGQDEIWVLNFRVNSTTGTRPPTESNGCKSIPVTGLTRVEGVSIVASDSLPKTITSMVPTTGQDFFNSTDSEAPLKWISGGKTDETVFTKNILFTPRGEAILETGAINTPDPTPYTLVGLGQTINGKLPISTKDAAVILISGFSGRITTIRP